MNILIITPFYKHDRNIASVRWTNIGIRLAKKHNVIIVTQPHDDMDMNTTIEKDEDNILVARINQKTWYEKTAIKHFGGATGDDWQTSAGTGEPMQAQDDFKRKLKNRVLYASMRRKAKRYADEIVQKVIPKDMKIDVVISSACPFIEMLFGYELKKRLNCKWISDFRDLPFIEDNCDDTHIQKKIMQDALFDADAIITIANKGKEKLADGIVDNPNKIHVIRNGFSLADTRETTTIQDDKLHIVHTGSLYGGKRKADLLFKAVLAVREREPDFKYVLECAGGNNETIIESAKLYQEENNVINNGFVSREQALDMQSKADLLLAVVINRPGSLVAKLYEYMLNKKPVICITCGNDIENSEETDFVRQLCLGIAVEESDGDCALKELTDYLFKQWRLKVYGRLMFYQPNNEMINKFNHDNIAAEIEHLCFSI
jgi:glycosyltransferase involved in cell wall biosynthesis